MARQARAGWMARALTERWAQLAVFVLAAALAAGEPPKTPPVKPPKPPLPVAEIRVGGRSSYSLVADEPSLMPGGVEIRVGGALLRADTIRYWLGPGLGGQGNMLDRVEVLPGVVGPADERVLFDSMDADLPQLGLRTRLSPRAIHMHRLPMARGASAMRYRANLPDVGVFPAEMRMDEKRWSSFSCWAQRIEAILVAGPGSVGDLRLESIFLYGSPDPAAAHGWRQARVVQTERRPADPASVVGSDVFPEQTPPGELFRIHGNDLTLHFDEDGQFRAFSPGINQRQRGRLDDLVQIRPRSRPELERAPAAGNANRAQEPRR